MTREELIKLHEDTCNAARKTMIAKSKDYACNASDPFSNFNGSIVFEIEPPVGIILRIQDKLKRIFTFVKTGKLNVENEGVEDAIQDAINYLILIKGLIRDKAEK